MSFEDDLRLELLELLDQSHLSILPWKKFFMKTMSCSYDQRRRLQLRLLKAIGQEFDLNIQDWNDFYKLKTTTKDDLRDFSPHNQDFAIQFETSGSSGTPFSFYRDKSLEQIDAAIFERAWYMVGRTNQLVLRLVTGTPKWKFYDAFRNIVPMDYRKVDDAYVDWVIREKPFLIHGVASAVRELTHLIVHRGAESCLKDSVAYLMSEDTRTHNEALSKVFRNVFMGYGTSECRTVASQCKNGTLHVNMETTIAESIDGELVVTNLFNKVMPFIRYRTGDKGEVLQSKSCECGLTSDIIVGLEGKVIDFYAEGLKKPIGRHLVSPITHEYNHLVKAWRLEVALKKRLIRVFVVPKTESMENFKPYLAWLEENTGFETQLIIADSLPDSRTKLLKVVEN